MTATPWLFKPNAKDAVVEQGLLADYRVLILAVNETAISTRSSSSSPRGND